MRFLLFGMTISSLLFLSACLMENPDSLNVEMFNTDGDRVGTAILSEQEEAVSIELDLEGLEPGFHAIHVHEYGKCEGPDFTSSGNHLNPEGMEHGLMHPEGPHLGDMPNIEADSGGLVTAAELELPETTLKEGKNSLIGNNGTSLIVHDGEDDGISQPGGDSGNRIICGVIQETQDSGESEEAPSDPTEDNEEQEE